MRWTTSSTEAGAAGYSHWAAVHAASAMTLLCEPVVSNITDACGNMSGGAKPSLLTPCAMTPSTSTSLSLDQANAICRELVPIGEQIFDFVEKLKAAGFGAFAPYEEFITSFAHDGKEVALHRKISVETAKVLLGSPWPMSLVEGKNAKRYRSAFLDALTRATDEKTYDDQGQIGGKRTPKISLQRFDINPCRRRMAHLKFSDRVAYDTRWALVVKAMSLLVQNECLQFASHISRQHSFDLRGRYTAYIAIMGQEAKAFGFHYDRLKSRANFPVFSKKVSSNGHLCWALEESSAFCWNSLEGRYMPYLELRHRDLRGSISKAGAGEYLHIRHSAIVPGFYNAYRVFSNLQKLETIIKAHLCLYGVMEPIITDALGRALSWDSA